MVGRRQALGDAVPWFARMGMGWRVLLAAGLSASAMAQGDALTEDDLLWRAKMGWSEQVHGTDVPESLAKVLARAPYAYYPYANELEVLFDYQAAIRPLSARVHDHPNSKHLDAENRVKTVPAALPDPIPARVVVRVLKVDGDRMVASQPVPLDGQGRGHVLFTLPPLEAGTYRVEYDLGGGAVIRSNRTFTRSHFEFERNDIGKLHEVFAPFTPVKVEGRTVSVVDRTYTLNAQGLFDSVVSQGRELLAEPVRLVVELEDGEPVEWETGLFGDGVTGKVLHPDTAVFQTTAKGSGFKVQGSVTVEEDGCAKVVLALAPETRHPKPIQRAYLRIALKEAEAPLCHLVGMNSMRHNYAGSVPRGGNIAWINQSWRPARFEVKPFDGEVPAAYEVWDATRLMHWGGQFWNFAPYVWLGAEERGLAWFGDHTAGYETDGKRGLQRLRIEPGKVVLHVELIQRPIVLDQPRTFTFGLQASPTKPMPEGWRGYAVPGGGGMAVNVWGGYNCASHYPDPKDWRIVEKIVSARDPEVNRNVWKGDFRAFFEELDKQRQFPELKVHGRTDWLENVLGFASRARVHRNGITVYYEEFQTSGLHPESYEYMDEWDLGSWCRFTKFNYEAKPFTDSRAWGPQARTANQESWRDFAVYYADQWMKRGVGIYYDNTYPQVDRNRFNLRGTGLVWQSSIWGHREYFRRVWKRSRQLMASGELPIDPYDPANPQRLRLHTVGHVTNGQVLPCTTWWDATLGVEQPGPWLPDVGPSEEDIQRQVETQGFAMLPTPKAGAAGKALPIPPDYLRAMEMGRTAGLVSHYRHALRSEDAFGGLGISYGSTDRPTEEVLRHRRLSDRAMGLVHEIRGGSVKDDDTRTLKAAWDDYGYGQPDVAVHNYWDDTPFLKVRNPDIKWIVLERTVAAGARQDPVLALLQSYDAEACETRIDLPPGTVLLDVFTRRLQPGDEPVRFEADFGTRLFLVGSPESLSPLAWDGDVLLRGDFEFGLPPAWRDEGGAAPRIVEDPEAPGNHVLRIVPGHPSQNKVMGTTTGDYDLGFRFRMAPLNAPPAHPQFQGVLQLVHRQASPWPKASGQQLQVGVQRAKDGKPSLALKLVNQREGREEAFGEVTTDRLQEVGQLVPLDTAWHTLTISVRGTRHTIGMDGAEVFSGTTDVSDGGALLLSPGWGNWSPVGVDWVDVDELVVRRTAAVE